MKKTLIKQIAMIGAVVVGMLAFGGTTQASAANYHFNSRTITYHVSASSKRWKNIWAKAIHNFDNNGTIKLKAASKKKAKMQLTTFSNTGHYKGVLGPIEASFGTNEKVFTHTYVKLNWKLMNKYGYTNKQRMCVATNRIAGALGLSDSSAKNSVLNDNEWNYRLTAGDKLAIAKAYKGVK
ncbi:hypothetical protein LZ22198_MCBDPFMK_02500 [Levilactobacillus zymae]